MKKMEKNEITVYCPVCGYKLPYEMTVCSSCGKNIKSLCDVDKPGTSGVATRKNTLESLRRFLTSKKRKNKEPPKDNLVKMSVGLMQRNENGKLEPVRGTVVPISVPQGSDAKQLQKAAEQKLKTINKDLNGRPCLLLYPDGTEITNIPGTEIPFSLKQYKETVGKNYQRITLYICTAEDFLSCSQETTSESDSADTVITVYCPVCGYKLPYETTFCSLCGKNITSLCDVDKPGTSGVATRKNTLESLRRFRTSKKRKNKEPPKDNLVKMSVGLMQRNEYGELEPVRGTVVPISVPQGSDAKQLQKAAEQKLKTINKDLNGRPCLLLYPDGTEITNIPGTEITFSLKQYKETVGKHYQRITLYICTAEDFLPCSQETTSESDSADTVEPALRSDDGESCIDSAAPVPALTSDDGKSCIDSAAPVLLANSKAGPRTSGGAKKTTYYRIPSGSRPFQANRRRLWVKIIKRVNGGAEELHGNARVCGAHFISGEASMDHDSPDFVPSVFACTTPKKQSPSPKKRVRGREMFYGLKKRLRRCQTADVETEETPSEGGTSEDLDSSMGTTEEVETPSTPPVSKERETSTTEAKTLQLTPSPKKTSPSFKLPAGLPKLCNMNPFVLLKPLIMPLSEYQCEQCNDKFTSVSQLTEHKQQHEEEKSVPCEICGTSFSSQALFTEHQCVHAEKPSFACNMCHRTFYSNHNLKRHKLLHVRDGRKCSKCGVLFCRRHNHILFVPQAEPTTESEQDCSIVETENLMPENDVLEKVEPSQTDDVADDAQSSQTVATTTTTTTSEPLPKNYKTSPPVLPTNILTEVPFPMLIKPFRSSLPLLPRSTSFQFKPPVPPDYPAVFIQPHLPQHPELPYSLRVFSPQCLTSALLEVKRNYKYICNKEVKAKEKEMVHVKVEQSETPLISPVKQRSREKVKKERTAYDLEIVL
ncbi:zinc finger protein 271-like isoform X1 [Scomber scombrus]